MIFKKNKMLTKHQQEILDASIEILKTKNRLVIKGSAGVGKTYLVNDLIKYFYDKTDKTIYCTAPTNKAVQVLKEKVVNYSQIKFQTIHSALKLKRKISASGTVSYAPNLLGKKKPLNNAGLLVIDEVSMLSSKILKFIEQNASKDLKIIFIGDDKQLLPVKEKTSPVFHKGYDELELTEIIRQTVDNPIIDLSRNLPRIRIEENNLNTEGKGYIFTKNLQKVIEELANGDNYKYLGWTNTNIDSVNTAVRLKLYGPNADKYELGESLIFNAPYGKLHCTNEEFSISGIQTIYREFTYVVEEGKNSDITKTALIKVYAILTNSDDTIYALHNDSLRQYANILKDLKSLCIKKKISWAHYYSFQENFADLKYCHALTVHKSQGSTYKNVIINLKNLRLNRDVDEVDRLFYTAITRASDLVIFYNN